MTASRSRTGVVGHATLTNPSIVDDKLCLKASAVTSVARRHHRLSRVAAGRQARRTERVGGAGPVRRRRRPGPTTTSGHGAAQQDGADRPRRGSMAMRTARIDVGRRRRARTWSPPEGGAGATDGQDHGRPGWGVTDPATRTQTGRPSSGEEVGRNGVLARDDLGRARERREIANRATKRAVRERRRDLGRRHGWRRPPRTPSPTPSRPGLGLAACVARRDRGMSRARWRPGEDRDGHAGQARGLAGGPFGRGRLEMRLAGGHRLRVRWPSVAAPRTADRRQRRRKGVERCVDLAGLGSRWPTALQALEEAEVAGRDGRSELRSARRVGQTARARRTVCVASRRA